MTEALDLLGLNYLLTPQSRIYWLYLLSSALIAAVFLHVRPQYRIGVSRAIWLHPSAKLDYMYFVLISLIKAALIAPLMLSASDVALWVNGALGYREPLHLGHTLIVALYTLSLFVVSDFTRYWLHRWLHSVPFLWRLHRVHHSAEVLNPLTFYRVHPIENILFGLRYALSAGVVTGVFITLFGARIGVAEFLGANALVALFNLAGANLRHSHLPLRFGDTLEHWFISPYMHQLHHAIGTTYTNYGGALSVWDRLFGTLHVSPVRPLEFGANVRHDTLAALFFEPFTLEKKDEQNPIIA
ncbi:MAG: sterol desaturase family protein [Campylobacterales bacterium]|nr:sterol desaturase family protein [Campylobacterales bacterium]